MSSHIDRAEMLLDVHRPKEAAQVLLDFLAIQPEDAHSHAMLARCFLQLKKYRDAERETEEAIRIAPDDAYGYYIHSFALQNLKRLKEARRAIDESLRLSPTYAYYLAQSANLWSIDGNHDNAILDARRGLQSDPQHLSCACELAYALMCKGELTEANKVMQVTLAQHPDRSRVHATYGWIAHNSRKYRLARTHFFEALRIDPTNSWAEDGLVESDWVKSGLDFFAAFEAVPPSDGISNAAGIFFLYCVVFGMAWMTPWEPTLKKPNPTLSEIFEITIVKAILSSFGLILLMGSSLSKISLTTTRLGRSRLKPGEFFAAIVAWVMPLLAVVITVVGSLSKDPATFAAGCVLYWGAIPLAGIGRFQSIAGRCVLGLFSILYFASGAACVANRLANKPHFAINLETISIWYIVIGLCIPLVLWFVTLLEPKES